MSTLGPKKRLGEILDALGVKRRRPDLKLVLRALERFAAVRVKHVDRTSWWFEASATTWAEARSTWVLGAPSDANARRLEEADTPIMVELSRQLETDSGGLSRVGCALLFALEDTLPDEAWSEDGAYADYARALDESVAWQALRASRPRGLRTILMRLD